MHALRIFRETIGFAFTGKESAPTCDRPRKKFCEKEESINRARKQFDEDCARRQKQMETKIREANEEFSLPKQDAKDKLCKLDGAMDKELGLSLPKNDTKSETNEDGSSNHGLGKDMWKQLTTVSIPVFSGDKRCYGSWKAAFMICVDKAPVTAEYKLLQFKK